VTRQAGAAAVVGLLTTVTEPYGRVSMHGVREEIVRAQAEAAGLPLVRASIPAPCPNEVYEQAMRTAIEEAKRQGVTQMIFGDLFLDDVRAYRERQLAGTGISPVFPLWLRPTRQVAEEMIAAGLVAYVTCVDPKKLPAEMAGRVFDRDFLDRLGPEVDPCAEQGEFHTCVTAGPMFTRSVPVEAGETLQRDGFVFADLKLKVNGPHAKV
jgi:uncharacterized protein (TIGR00290 family)